MPETIHVGPLQIRFLRSKHDTGGSLDLFEMVVPPTGRMPVAHYHQNWEETAYGLEGTLTFVVDGQPHEVGPGNTVFVPRGVVHSFANRSGAPCKVLSVLTPGVLGPEYFRELGALAAAGPPDPGRMREVMLRHGLVPA